jgi:hypothetical protein
MASGTVSQFAAGAIGFMQSCSFRGVLLSWGRAILAVAASKFAVTTSACQEASLWRLCHRHPHSDGAIIMSHRPARPGASAAESD